ncbi:HNH endonuclease, partial [Paenibacillus ottowii]|uniref:HNH endonuclease n=1 Tax=Paenibacillus ottowii TaxID=2315729 RepID=UPI003D2ECEF1
MNTLRKNILKDIFIELFYQKLFDNAKIWGIIDSHSTTFSRQIFHENFKRENNIYICPYCDTDTIISDGNIVIEHFIPKSDYPFVSMHPNNLMSSCYGCNGIYGKHTKYYAPIYSPYNVQIGELIKFGIDFSEKKVTLDGAGELKVDNYIKTLRLEPKYSKRDVFDLV